MAASPSSPANQTSEPAPAASREPFAAFTAAVYEGGALPRKTKELIAVAVASVQRGSRRTGSYSERAKEAGASEAEIAEARSVARAQAGGTQVFWMKEDLEDLLGARWRRDFLPEANRAFWDFKDAIFEGAALERSSKELVAVAVSCALRCRHCTRSHIESAFEAGASKQEVAEALAVLWAVGSEPTTG